MPTCSICKRDSECKDYSIHIVKIAKVTDFGSFRAGATIHSSGSVQIRPMDKITRCVCKPCTRKCIALCLLKPLGLGTGIIAFIFLLFAVFGTFHDSLHDSLRVLSYIAFGLLILSVFPGLYIGWQSLKEFGGRLGESSKADMVEWELMLLLGKRKAFRPRSDLGHEGEEVGLTSSDYQNFSPRL